MMPIRRRLLTSSCAALGAFALAGCAGMFGPPTVRLDEAELQERLARRFPVQRRVLELFELQLTDPRLGLLPQDNRLSLDMKLFASEGFTGRRIEGRTLLSFGLRFEMTDGSVRLVQPRVEQFEFGAQGSRLGAQARSVAGSLVEALLDDEPLYRLKPERLQKLRESGYTPKPLRVTAQGVEIAFEAAGASR
jgi:hypothetical protein